MNLSLSLRWKRLLTDCAWRVGPEGGKCITMIVRGGLWLTQGQNWIRESHVVVDMDPRSGRRGQVCACAVVRYGPWGAGGVPVWV